MQEAVFNFNVGYFQLCRVFFDNTTLNVQTYSEEAIREDEREYVCHLNPLFTRQDLSEYSVASLAVSMRLGLPALLHFTGTFICCLALVLAVAGHLQKTVHTVLSAISYICGFSLMKLVTAIVVGSSCGSLAALCILFVAAWDLCFQIRDMVEQVTIETENFKDQTDIAWDDLMIVQMKMEGPKISRRSIVARDVFMDIRNKKKKKDTRWDPRLPEWCQCEVTRPQCPLGPPGPPGAPGRPGPPGIPGPRGRDNYQTILPPACDYRQSGCVRCPTGPPGRRGSPGRIGLVGSPGEPGRPGYVTRMGPAGPPGPQGDPGHPGGNGRPGALGLPGKGGVSAVRGKGAPGRPGRVGASGLAGRPGRAGKDGTPGPMGPIGSRGDRGRKGRPGEPGREGRPAHPGHDAGYCPCPRRSMIVKNRKIRA